MASIISSGIGSGLDIAGLVQQLVAAEAAPVQTRLAQQEARVQAKLSAFGTLKSALADFRDKLDVMRDASKFLARTAASGNEDLFTVSAAESALPASYSIEVAQLATAQKLTSGAFASSDTVVGTGTLSITVGADTFNLAIDSTNNTLAAIRDEINAAIDNTGVSATIVNADSGSYLILTGDNTGAANSITVTQSGGDGGLSALEYDPVGGNESLTETIAAQDALVRIDGFDVNSATNSVSGAIEGVTIDLVFADPGVNTSLVVSNDTETVNQTISDFVASYNALIDTFDELTSYNAEAEIAGPLLGDSTIRSVREQIRREFSEAVTDIEAPFSTLTDIGIEVQLDGKLSIEGGLAGFLDTDFAKIGDLFATSDGYAVRVYDLVDSYLATGGIIEARTEGLNNSIEGFSEQREALNDRLASLETRLLRQFNALDALLGELTTTSNFLGTQLNNLPGFTQPGNN